MQIRHVENGVQVLDWDSGKVTSAATSITVPSGKITEANKVFTVAVRVWDTKQREPRANSPYARWSGTSPTSREPRRSSRR